MTDTAVIEQASETELMRYAVRMRSLAEQTVNQIELLKIHAMAEAMAHLTRVRNYSRQAQATALSLVMAAEARLVAEADKARDAGVFRGRGRPGTIPPPGSELNSQPMRESGIPPLGAELSASAATGLNNHRVADARKLNQVGGLAAIDDAAAKIAETEDAPITRRAIVLTAKNGVPPLVDADPGEEARKRWRKWFWCDWRGDVRLRFCSLAARGLWAEMLAIMDEAKPVGYLVDDAGKPLSARQLAVQAAAPGGESEVVKLLDELETAGVFSRNGANVIYSRRVVRDEVRASRNRENGRFGGNPDLMENQGVTDRSVNPQSPEARVQNKNGDANASLLNAGAREETVDGSGKDLLGEPLAPSPDSKYPLTLTTPIPEPFIMDGIKRALMSAGEAQAEWSNGFVTYWAPRGSLRDGKKTTDGWRACWINYITGSICQKRLASQRGSIRARDSGSGRYPPAPGKLDAIREAIDRCEAFDRTRSVPD